MCPPRGLRVGVRRNLAPELRGLDRLGDLVPDRRGEARRRGPLLV